MTRSIAVILTGFAFISCVLISPPGRAEILFRTVALSGQQAPGTPAGINFTSFLRTDTTDVKPALNDLGQTAFYATVTGPGINANNESGIWSEGGGSFHLVAREGSQPPGLPTGAVFRFQVPGFPTLPAPVISNNGLSAFYGTVVGTGSGNNDTGIWLENGIGLQLVAREGSAAPGTSAGVVFDELQHPLISAAGHVVFDGQLTGSGVTPLNDRGIWSTRNGSAQLIARSGTQAPGMPAGIRFSFVTANSISADGYVAVTATIAGTEFRAGIWSESAAGLNLVVHDGLPAPGLEPGAVFHSFPSKANISDTGHTAFIANIDRPGGPAVIPMSVWTHVKGDLHFVMRRGDHAPGTTGDTRFVIPSNPIINDRGQVAFRASLEGSGVTGANSIGYWRTRAGELQLIVRTGNAAPGTDSGTVFSGLFDLPEFNDAGQLAFLANISGPGADVTNNTGIWATGPDGLRLVIRTGELFEVSPGEFRTISGLRFGDLGGPGFNNEGQVAFAATFTDGSSGVFVASGTIPEPTSIALITIAFAALGSRRRRGY